MTQPPVSHTQRLQAASLLPLTELSKLVSQKLGRNAVVSINHHQCKITVQVKNPNEFGRAQAQAAGLSGECTYAEKWWIPKETMARTISGGEHKHVSTLAHNVADALGCREPSVSLTKTGRGFYVTLNRHGLKPELFFARGAKLEQRSYEITLPETALRAFVAASAITR
jgi:hypothetical protein